ncbi:MAG: FadR/GntR family transcriptional regulator [Streptosporangiales bacterium]
METKRERAYQRIVDDVEDAVAGGRLKPGDRLASERDLVERFGVARSSVREALRVLESKQLVRSRPGDPRGPLVLGFSVEPVKRSIARLTAAHTVRLGELVQFRMVVDASANLLAAASRTDAQLLRLERNMARMRESMPLGYEAFGRLDLEFHEIIAEIGGNTLIRVCGDSVRPGILDLIQSRIADADDRRGLMLQSIRHHAVVFEAICEGDGGRASRLARESLYAYYADHVDPAERAVLADLVREVSPRWQP